MTTRLSEIELLDRLVGFNTVSSRSNLELIDFVRSYFDGLGVASTLLPDATGQKANFLATVGPADVPGYVLSGHTDVVPVEGQQWSRDPFRMWENDGRLYGRGTTDMKGFVACMLARVPAMLSQPLAVPFHLALSYDEEVGCLGAYGLVDHMTRSLPEQLAVFVGEPTGMGVVGGHKGSTGLLTTITGKACHSSRPDLGVNAIFHAVDVIGALRGYARELREAPETGSPFELPYTSVSVGVIQGGTARNAIAGDVSFQWDIRATRVGMVEELVERFRAYCDETVLPIMKAGFAGAAIDTDYAYDVPPLVPSEGSLAETLAKRFAGTNEVGTVNYGSEAGIFQRAGMPTIVCGPGRDSEAHITDEWVAIEQMNRCTDFIDGLIGHARKG